MVGTILQLLWIEQLPLGMNVPPDAALASLLSVGLGFTAGYRYETYVEREVCYTVALLIAVALGIVGRNLDVLTRRANTVIEAWVCQNVEKGWLHAVSVGHTLGGFLTFVKAFLFCFFVVWLGTEPLRYFIQSLNFNQNTGFIVIQGLLPAVGFAVLANKYLVDARETRRFAWGILLFTLLPASVWLCVLAAGVVGLMIYWEPDSHAK
jgi:mannose/fructose/N-acetylgalactosamine-specific phosphotransferase system component IIC